MEIEGHQESHLKEKADGFWKAEKILSEREQKGEYEQERLLGRTLNMRFFSVNSAFLFELRFLTSTSNCFECLPGASRHASSWSPRPR
jgi:hypothetical protein